MATQQDLASWMKASIQAPYQSAAGDAATQSFDSYATDISITINGAATTRDDFIQSVQQKTAAISGVSFDWGHVIVVPDDPSLPNESGIVSASYTMTRSLKIRIRAGPMQIMTKVVFQARVECDSPQSSYGSDTTTDSRKIVKLFMTSVDEQVPINFSPVVQAPVPSTASDPAQSTQATTDDQPTDDSVATGFSVTTD